MQNFSSFIGNAILFCFFLFCVGFLVSFIFMNIHDAIVEHNKGYKKTYWGFLQDCIIGLLILVGISCGIKYVFFPDKIQNVVTVGGGSTVHFPNGTTILGWSGVN